MKIFDDRLKVQKIIYLLQQTGINLGYSYSFYIYGPYCTGLARDAFQITSFSKIKDVGFENETVDDKFKEFVEKIGEHKNDVLWLEVASSIHLMKKLYPERTKNKIIQTIKEKRSELNNKGEVIIKVWEDINGWIING